MIEEYQAVHVAVVLIADASRTKLLLDYNARWGGFAPPMTKVGELPTGRPDQPTVPEPAERAAARAAAEVLGRPIPLASIVRLEGAVPPWHHSGSDNKLKHYKYQLFTLKLPFVPQPLPDHVAVWLTPDEVAALEPVSPTARHILNAVPFTELA